MKVATWNVNSIRTRQQIVADWLRKNAIDVLCLQETKVVDEIFPRSLFEELGYHLYVAGQKSYNGVAILSREPLQDVKVGFATVLGDELAEFDEQKRVLCGSTAQNVKFVNLYVPNGSAVGSDKYDYKLRWLKVLRQYLRSLRETGAELCVCGDFNIALEDRDIYQPKKDNHIMASPAEREALREVLEVGLRDAFRKFTAEGGHFSWWDYRQAGFERDRGWRIDHHYLTPQLYDRAVGCAIDVAPRALPQPSDHTPVVVEF
ncbi:exodeoxyribonuclease III [Oscillatoria sp. FACHB-1406]|uniref:exodeoxyribonuclease III n=1 Tax=Oscillatoria sp. FACHB-1406 TaxID=2692846 RepID=UPI001684138C|nr:exodeoxyribonuclease III [Oscillatoria sp. FACHB-1406]MBD2578464.1 exodeoxyribonuclease III [Oscillatoria sp. FACHB-1406]